MTGEGSRGAWYLLTGLLVGVVAGMAVALLFFPVKFVDTAPDSLSDGDKDSFRAVIALAYNANHDAGRANARLQLLHDVDPVSALQAEAQRFLANGEPPETAQSLARLAIALDKLTPAASPQPSATSNITAIFTPVASQAHPDIPTEPAIPEPSTVTVETSTPETGPSATPEPSPTPPPQDTLPAPAITIPPEAPAMVPPAYTLDKKEQVCDPAATAPQIQIDLKDQSGSPLAGVKINVTWDSSEDNFFTGLHQEVHPGYADFEMAPEIKYNLRIGGSSEIFSNLEAVKCTAKQGSDYWGGWKLQFTKH
jgi:hypothetical protein